jgi:hypothetical protein
MINLTITDTFAVIYGVLLICLALFSTIVSAFLWMRTQKPTEEIQVAWSDFEENASHYVRLSDYQVVCVFDDDGELMYVLHPNRDGKQSVFW